MKKILFLMCLFILLCSVLSAQEKLIQNPKRIAFINKYKLADENKGIEKLAKAIIAASDAGFIAETDPQKRNKIYEESYKKRSKIIVSPVENEISGLLREIENQNNLIILDVAELDRNGQILGLSDALDISDRVILLINSYFKTKSKPDFILSVPQTKIGKINSKMFLDKTSGILRITEKVKETEKLIKDKTGRNPTFDEVKEFLMKDQSKENLFFQIGNYIQSYAQANNLGVVFDSSGKLPVELENFQTFDITKDFISYYNLLNP